MTTTNTEVTLLVDADTAAAMCSIHRATWYKKAAAGQTPKAVRIGGVVRWRRQEIEDWIAHDCPARAKWEAMSKTTGTKSGRRS